MPEDSKEIMEGQKKGFAYSVSKEQTEEYSSWPIERRLQWLFLANKMRRFLPRKTIELKEAFRQGKICLANNLN
jgi:hypothetical protein